MTTNDGEHSNKENPMTSSNHQRFLLAGLLALGTLTSATTLRAEGGITPPAVPANLEVPAGHRPYLITHAVGTQNYVFLPRTSGTGMGWTFLAPQATGFNGRDEQVLTHYLANNPYENGVLRPSWQHSRDSSAVWAAPLAASNDPDYVEPGAVAWLLLEIRGAENGPTGGDRLARTTFIQRVHTAGGAAPAADCFVLGAKLFVPYLTDYVFYRAD
jgi:hypothetical protein